MLANLIEPSNGELKSFGSLDNFYQYSSYGLELETIVEIYDDIARHFYTITVNGLHPITEEEGVERWKRLIN